MNEQNSKNFDKNQNDQEALEIINAEVDFDQLQMQHDYERMVRLGHHNESHHNERGL